MSPRRQAGAACAGARTSTHSLRPWSAARNRNSAAAVALGGVPCRARAREARARGGRRARRHRRRGAGQDDGPCLAKHVAQRRVVPTPFAARIGQSPLRCSCGPGAAWRPWPRGARRIRVCSTARSCRPPSPLVCSTAHPDAQGACRAASRNLPPPACSPQWPRCAAGSLGGGCTRLLEYPPQWPRVRSSAAPPPCRGKFRCLRRGSSCDAVGSGGVNPSFPVPIQAVQSAGRRTRPGGGGGAPEMGHAFGATFVRKALQ